MNNALLQDATGPVEFRLTNDYLFRAVCQKNQHVLNGLISSLLGLEDDEIISATIQNPIKLGEAIDEKDVILDLNILLNHARLLNIEMQVLENGDWAERSLYYLCRAFCNLNKGDNYTDVLPTIHIGILDFILFPEAPEFYSKNLLMNVKTHQIYSSKFALNVLELKSINLATQEDKACKLDYWAKLFKATTWEEIKMLAEQNNTLHEAAVTMRELTADEKIRMQCEARERYERDQYSMIRTGQMKQKKIDEAIISAQAKEIEQLRQQLDALEK